MAESSLKPDFVTIYSPGEDLSGPPATRVSHRITLHELSGLWLSGEVEPVRIEILRPNGRIKIKEIWRYKPKSWKLRDRSCTMGPKVMESLVNDLWAGRPCMMTPISHGPTTL